jgi:hypothetical protein
MRTANIARFGGIVAIALAGAVVMATGSGSAHAAKAHLTAAPAPSSPSLTGQLAAARLATAKYATNLPKAEADGYQILTKEIPGMGYHFVNFTNLQMTSFDVRKPPILVYEHRGSQWQLAALEWVFPKIPQTSPLPNATFGFFPAACQYADGTFIPHKNSKTCPATAPGSGAKFTFWHPNLHTMHVWLWYPNPDGLYASMNPLVAPFNVG